KASGAGGEAVVTLVGATGAVAELVEAWETPPELAPDVDPVDPPPPTETPTPPTPEQTLRRSPAAAMPPAPEREAALDRAPDPQRALVQEALAAPPSQTTRPDAPALPNAAPPSPPTALTPPTAAPQPPAADRSPEARVEPLTKAERPPPRPKPTARPQPVPSTASPSTRAQGAGETPTAGAEATSAVVSLSAGQVVSAMQRWGGQVQRSIQRAQVYPRAAKGRRAEGTVTVALTLSPAGVLRAASLVRSSGNAALDQAALQAVQSVRSFPAAPDGLTNASYPFQVPIRFTLP
ncbi:MAG: TonB family protein, partial [Pseudomonadota bacterium]